MSDFLTENRTLQILHNTVKSYERDALSFYTQIDHANSKFTGRFDFKVFAKKIFDPIETAELAQLYVDMLEESSSYMLMHQKTRIGVNNYQHSFLSVPELLLNMILAYQLPQQKFVPFDKKDDGAPHEDAGEGGSKKKRRAGAAKKGKNVTIKPRVVLTNELAAKLLQGMIKIPLAPEIKIWKQAKYILCPSNCPQQLKIFGDIIAQTTRAGVISFNALHFFMHDAVLNRYLEDPITILHALYIGPLCSQTVELFAANRSDAFRQQCRDVLKIAVSATEYPMTFRQNIPAHLSPTNPEIVKYRVFVDNVNNLIRDMNGQPSANVGLHAGWACAAIKKFGHKRYVEKTWRDENYYDLIWTVLAQRPHLKKFVVEVLEKTFKDYDAARFWRRMQPYQMNRTLINNQNVINEDPLKLTEDFLNFPAYIKNIHVVSTDQHIEHLQMLLGYKVSREERIYVGVDAEWSAYVSPSKATILQMALSDCIYIIDLESMYISPVSYHSFLSYLFNTEEIVKIGFQFGEDLHQLRAGFRNCSSLYQPNNVVCVGKLIIDLIDEIQKLENSEEFKRTHLPFLGDDLTNVKESADTSIDEGQADKSISNDSMEGLSTEPKPAKEDTMRQQFLNKGLSFLCEKFLGRPLDKTEQCSVWDRRPLRPLQLRYAAMDAFCMLMLYDAVKSIFQKLSLDADEFLSRQSPIRISLPLLSEAPL